MGTQRHFNHRFGLPMKWITLILVFVIGFPPLQAGYCDMPSGHDASHQMIAHDHQGSPGHKCCEPEQPDSQQNCGGDMMCGSCGVTASSIPVVCGVLIAATHAPSPDISSGLITPSHSPPLYRPPIS